MKLDLRNAANSLQIEGKGGLLGDPTHEPIGGGGWRDGGQDHVYIYIYNCTNISTSEHVEPPTSNCCGWRFQFVNVFHQSECLPLTGCSGTSICSNEHTYHQVPIQCGTGSIAASQQSGCFKSSPVACSTNAASAMHKPC